MIDGVDKDLSGSCYTTLRERAFKQGDVILGRYRILAELGQGGMGVVYKCLDETGGVEVAVKCLPRDVSCSSAEMEDVRRNYQIVQGLVHENIAALKTLESDERGDYFVVMELARGVNLKKWAERYAGLEKIPEKISILRQIALALDYAHSAKPKYVIHRDIKPENIMVDEDVHVKVLDFGLAAQVQSSMSHVSMMVTSRSGTAAYKSPEQWMAQVQKAAADQYSLGVVAYYLFAGNPPFDSEDVGILKHAVLHDPIPPIQGLSKTIFRALQKVLAKQGEDRFETCVDFVAALEGKKIAAKGVKRPGKWIAAILCVTLAAAAGVWGWNVSQQRQREERARIAAQRESERGVAEKAATERKAREEAARAAAEKAEEERIAAAKAAQERQAKAEAERVAKEEADRMAAAKAAQERQAKAEAERVAKEKARNEADAEYAAQQQLRPSVRGSARMGGVQLWKDGPYWAECNVGAEKPEESGYYFWWGDTVGYKRNLQGDGWVSAKYGKVPLFAFLFSFSFYDDNCETFGKNNDSLRNLGYIDTTGNLVAEHDAATTHLGAPWRMPTCAEIQALVNNCDRTWTKNWKDTGVAGYVVKGKDDYSTKSIFLPAAGYGGGSDLDSTGSDGCYWSSSPNSDYSNDACGLYFDSRCFYQSDSRFRCVGLSVRPLRGFAK